MFRRGGGSGRAENLPKPASTIMNKDSSSRPSRSCTPEVSAANEESLLSRQGDNQMKKVLYLVAALCLALAPAGGLAQDISTTGVINGTVTDTAGASVQNAAVTISGQTLPQPRTTTTSEQGSFEVSGLIPGAYTVKVELAGFKTASVESLEVNVGRASSLNIKLEPGAVSEVVNVTDAAATDLSSTAVGQNLSDTLFDNIPVQRSVTSLFYLAPGVADSGKGGTANPSISGGSAL